MDHIVQHKDLPPRFHQRSRRASACSTPMRLYSATLKVSVAMHFSERCIAGMRTALDQSAARGGVKHGHESRDSTPKKTPWRQTNLPSRLHARFMVPNSSRILRSFNLNIASFILLRSCLMRAVNFPSAAQSSGLWLPKIAKMSVDQ